MCIDDRLLSSYLDCELKEPYKSQVEEHLSYCNACKSRLDRLSSLDTLVKSATIDDSALLSRMDQTYQILEKKCFTNKKKISFWRRKLELSLTQAVSAAGIIVVFIGSFILFGRNTKQTSDIMPAFAIPASSENVHFVSTKNQGLDSYSLEEIMKYLDSKGYNVDISIKGLKPIE